MTTSRIFRQLLYTTLLWALCLNGTGQVLADAQEFRPHVARLEMAGAIGPATTDYLRRGLNEAVEAGATLAVLTLDTPGGLDAATRDIVKLILDAPMPIAAYVHPAGGRAASAGTYILLASHIAAMSPSTTLGAATPVSIGGGGKLPGGNEAPARKEKGAPEQPRAEAPGDDDAMRHKVVNDAVAFIRGLAARHGRNADWAERAVREAATLTADEALAENVVDVVAGNVEELLAQIDGRTVKVRGVEQPLATAGLAVEAYEPDWRNELLALLTNPQVAYILLMIGIYGLLFEGYSPGALVPGTVGIICLLLGLYALQLLPLNYAGLALIVAGALLMVSEAFVPSFGALGIGGVVALVLGSLMLFDTDVPGMEISRGLIAGVALVALAALALLFFVIGKTLRLKRPAVSQELVGELATVRICTDEQLQVSVRGELWQAHSKCPLAIGQRVQITAERGLTLEVAPLASTDGEPL